MTYLFKIKIKPTQSKKSTYPIMLKKEKITLIWPLLPLPLFCLSRTPYLTNHHKRKSHNHVGYLPITKSNPSFNDFEGHQKAASFIVRGAYGFQKNGEAQKNHLKINKNAFGFAL